VTVQTERELEELQKRIDWRRANLHIGEANRKPVAVRLFDDCLFYGEYFEDEPNEDVTFFGLPQRPFLSSRQCLLQVAVGLNHTEVPMTVRMGDTRSQPYEGKAVSVGQQLGSYGWFTTLRFVADKDGVVLVRHAEVAV